MDLSTMKKSKKYLVCRDTYMSNGSLAVSLYDGKEMVAVITVNIDASDCIGTDDCAYVDTNNCVWVEEFLQDNKIAFPTGEYGFSGFCAYPLYKFDLRKLEEYKDA